MKYIIAFIVGILITLSVLDYLESKMRIEKLETVVKSNRRDIKEHHEQIWSDDQDDLGLIWRYFNLRDRIEALEEK